MKKFLTIIACFAFALFGLLGFAGCGAESMTAEEVGAFMETVEMDEKLETGYKMTMDGMGMSGEIYVLFDQENYLNSQIKMRMHMDVGDIFDFGGEEEEEVPTTMDVEAYYKNGIIYLSAGEDEKYRLELNASLEEDDPFSEVINEMQNALSPNELDAEYLLEMMNYFVENETFKASKKVNGNKTVITIKGEEEGYGTSISLTFKGNALQRVSVKTSVGKNVVGSVVVESYTGTIQFPSEDELAEYVEYTGEAV